MIYVEKLTKEYIEEHKNDPGFIVDVVIAYHDVYLELLKEVEYLRCRRNELSKKIAEIDNTKK